MKDFNGADIDTMFNLAVQFSDTLKIDYESLKRAVNEIQKREMTLFNIGISLKMTNYDAYFKNESGNYEASNAAVQILAKDFSGYKRWGAKGLVLMADNFYELDDTYQATYILENVIKNFQNYPEIVQEAKQELSRIKTEAAKTNSSVEANN